mgnify:FL=1
MKKKKQKNLPLIKLKNLIKGNFIIISIFLVLIIVGAAMYVSNNQPEEELVYGDDVIDMYYFHLSTCPHCHKQNAFHEELKQMYPNLRINEYEITQPSSKDKILEMFNQYEELDPERISTPTTIIGDNVNVGYGTDETTGQKLIEMIEEEQAKIDANWDSQTMTRTITLRTQESE